MKFFDVTFRVEGYLTLMVLADDDDQAEEKAKTSLKKHYGDEIGACCIEIEEVKPDDLD